MKKGPIAPFRTEQRFETLARLAQAVTASLSLADVLDTVARAATDVFRASAGRIWVVSGDRLHLRAEAGILGPPHAGRKTVLALGEGVTGWVAVSRRSLAVDNVLADPRTVNVEWARREGYVSFLGIPLLVRDRLVGVLGLFTRQPHRFSAEEAETLTSFATQAAIAINNARLFEETEHRRQAAESLARVAKALSESLDVSAVGTRLVESLLPIFGARSAVLRVIDTKGELTTVAAAGAPGDSAPAGAAVTATLRTEGRMIGELSLVCDAAPDFPDEEAALLQTYADQAALAVENARLYEEARDARDFLRSIAENSADAIVTADFFGRITYFSPGAERIFGYRADEMLGKPISDYCRGGRDEAIQLFQRLRAEGQIRDYESAFRAKSGRSIDVNASVSLLRDARNAIVGAVVVMRDMTERKHTGEALARQVREISHLSREVQRRESFIRNVVESLREGLVVLDREGRVVTWNRAMESLSGVETARAVGQHYLTLFPDGRGERLAAPVERLLGGDVEELALQALEHQSPQKGRVVWNVKGSLLRERGEPAGAALLVEDITEQVALEHSTRQTEKMAALGTLCAGIAHEVNNPIGIISSRIQLMLSDGEGDAYPASLRQDLLVLHRNAQRVARIAHGLLSFSRHSTGVRAPVNLNRVVEETLLLVERQLAKASIRLKTVLDPSLPAVVGDANALQQVVLNLVTNSWEAMTGAGGDICIEVGHGASGTVDLAVADTGPGIPPEVLPKIFDPFYTTKPEGTGLGLSVSYGIIRDHQGVVEVRSEPGRTVFTLSFPAAPETP